MRRTIKDLMAEARASIGGLTPQAAATEASDGALVVDTRCADLRRATGIIPGSVHVPLSLLYWRLDPASASADPALTDLNRRIILVCAHGYSSSLAAATLRQLGFATATDIVGGFEAWKEAGLPVDTV